jgi:hypothetical protein
MSYWLICYSLRSIKLVAKMDVCRCILVVRYIHFNDKFYGMEGIMVSC